MKKLLIAFTLTFITLFAHAGDPKIIKDTIINKITYHLYEGPKGGHYIIKTSKTDGHQYKSYLKRGQ